MAQVKNRKQLLQDLPLEERKRKLMSVAQASGMSVGVSGDKIRDDYVQSLPADERGKWHVAWFYNQPQYVRVQTTQGYEVCKIKEGTKNIPVEFKTDILMRVPKDVYEARLEADGASARNWDFEDEIEDTSELAKMGEVGDDD